MPDTSIQSTDINREEKLRNELPGAGILQTAIYLKYLSELDRKVYVRFFIEYLSVDRVAESLQISRHRTMNKIFRIIRIVRGVTETPAPEDLRPHHH